MSRLIARASQRRARLVVLAGLAILWALSLTAVQAAPVLKPSRSVVLVIDTSGSMNEATSDGVPKIDSARQAATRFVDQAGDAELALVTLGQGCAQPNGNLRQEFSQDHGPIKQTIGGLTARGGTPLSTTIQFAIQYLKQKHQADSGQIVVMTDGQDECNGLTDQDFVEVRTLNVKIDGIGFNIPPGSPAEQYLQGVAGKTGGTFARADSQRELEDAFNRVSQGPENLPVPPGAAAGAATLAAIPLLLWALLELLTRGGFGRILAGGRPGTGGAALGSRPAGVGPLPPGGESPAAGGNELLGGVRGPAGVVGGVAGSTPAGGNLVGSVAGGAASGPPGEVHAVPPGPGSGALEESPARFPGGAGLVGHPGETPASPDQAPFGGSSGQAPDPGHGFNGGSRPGETLATGGGGRPGESLPSASEGHVGGAQGAVAGQPPSGETLAGGGVETAGAQPGSSGEQGPLVAGHGGEVAASPAGGHFGEQIAAGAGQPLGALGGLTSGDWVSGALQNAGQGQLAQRVAGALAGGGQGPSVLVGGTARAYLEAGHGVLGVADSGAGELLVLTGQLGLTQLPQIELSGRQALTYLQLHGYIDRQDRPTALWPNVGRGADGISGVLAGQTHEPDGQPRPLDPTLVRLWVQPPAPLPPTPPRPRTPINPALDQLLSAEVRQALADVQAAQAAALPAELADFVARGAHDRLRQLITERPAFARGLARLTEADRWLAVRTLARDTVVEALTEVG